MKNYIISGSIVAFFAAAVIFAQSQNLINQSRGDDSESNLALRAEQSGDSENNPFGEGAERVGELGDDKGGEQGGGDDDASISLQKSDDRRSGDDDENEDEDEIEDGDDDSVSSGAGSNTGSGASAGTVQTTPAAHAVVVTRATLALHNKQSDCWVAYKGTVYNITSWLPRHPGSAGAIAPYCGTAEEFTAAFSGQHGTSQESRLKKEGSAQGALQ